MLGGGGRREFCGELDPVGGVRDLPSICRGAVPEVGMLSRRNIGNLVCFCQHLVGIEYLKGEVTSVGEFVVYLGGIEVAVVIGREERRINSEILDEILPHAEIEGNLYLTLVCHLVHCRQGQGPLTLKTIGIPGAEDFVLLGRDSRTDGVGSMCRCAAFHHHLVIRKVQVRDRAFHFDDDAEGIVGLRVADIYLRRCSVNFHREAILRGIATRISSRHHDLILAVGYDRSGVIPAVPNGGFCAGGNLYTSEYGPDRLLIFENLDIQSGILTGGVADLHLIEIAVAVGGEPFFIGECCKLQRPVQIDGGGKAAQIADSIGHLEFQ